MRGTIGSHGASVDDFGHHITAISDARHACSVLMTKVISGFCHRALNAFIEGARHGAHHQFRVIDPGDRGRGIRE
ncbi:MAG: hypothetical protein ACXW5U_26005 [Thermoanaerobaculia bacterium]